MTSRYKVIYEAFQSANLSLFFRLSYHLHWRELPAEMALLVEPSIWWQSTLTSGVVHPFSLVLPCFSTHAQLLSLILFLLFPFSPRRTRRKGRKGMREFQEGSGRQCPLLMLYLPAEAGALGAAVGTPPRDTCQGSEVSFPSIHLFPATQDLLPFSCTDKQHGYAVAVTSTCLPTVLARQLIQEQKWLV